MTTFINNERTKFVKWHCVLKDLFIKEKWFLFFCLTVKLTGSVLSGLSVVSAADSVYATISRRVAAATRPLATSTLAADCACRVVAVSGRVRALCRQQTVCT